MTAAAMLSCECRRWGDRDDDDGEEEVVEVDDNDETTRTSASPPPATTDPSPPWRIHPPRPSPVLPVGGWTRGAAATMTRTTWRCCTGGAGRRQRLGQRAGAAQVGLDVGNANADGANAMVGCGYR